MNRISIKKILVLLFVFISFLMAPFLNFFNVNQNFIENEQKENKEKDLFVENLKTQDLTSDNTFSGIGTPWNVSHWANRTDYDLSVSFTNNFYDDSQKIDLDSGWEGYQLNATVNDLYDTRNWINGSFNCGSFTGNSPVGINDSDYVYNWTFYDFNSNTGAPGPYDNTMTGNYYDDGYAVANYQDCLELVINGGGGSNEGYDKGDKCWWSSNFTIPRGDVEDAWLNLAVYPRYFNDYGNHFSMQIIINGKNIWSRGLLSLVEECGNPSGDWFNVQPIFLDTSDTQLFPVGSKSMNVTIEFKRVGATLSTSSYDTIYGLFFDNVSLTVKAKAKPSQLELQMNNKNLKDTSNWGEGLGWTLGNWNGSEQSWVNANFSSNLNWPLTFEEDGSEISYKIELDTNLTLYANKSTPESYYTADPDLSYQGSSFITSNNSNVNWTTYAHMEIPTGYEEMNMTVEFPSDYNLTGVFLSQDSYSSDQTPVKVYGTKKIVNIPISSLTSNTNGFWKITAEAPNYCKEMGIYKNTTLALDNWELAKTLLSGDYINITAKINISKLVSGYFQQTEAQLQIRFPNGSFWTGVNQFKNVKSTGMVHFDAIEIPSKGVNYKVGDYQAIVTWNNSYSNFDLNETGIIYNYFTVTHNSSLEAVDEYFSDVYVGDTVNLRVTFTDLINSKPIEGATISVTNFTGGVQYFNDLDNGDYLLIFNTSGGDAGENNITIYATHPSYEKDQINITIELIFYTSLTADEYPSIEVPWNNNATIHLNYTVASDDSPILDANPSVYWNDDWFIKSGNGLYNITCNTSKYQVNTAPNLRIDFDEIGYESQTIIISIEVVERETSITEIFINDNNCTINKTANVHSGEMVNITVQYKDIDAGGTPIHNAFVTLNGTGIGEIFDDNNNFYNLTFNSTKLDVGITFLNIIAQKDNYTAITEKLTINVYEREAEYWLYLNGAVQGKNPTISLYDNQLLNITLTYNDTLLIEHIPDAIVDINGSGISELLDEKFNNYSVVINTTDLNQGVNFLTIFARKDGYEAHSILLVVEIIQIETNLTLYLNGVDKTSNPSITLYPNEILNITVSYNNSDILSHIPDAIVDINGSDISEVLDEKFNKYSVLINTIDLNQGVNFLTIFARKDGYEPQTISIVIEIGQIGTDLTIITNGADLTLSPFFNLTISQSLNITIKYTDQIGAFIPNATILLLGGGLSLDLMKDNNFDQYYRMLNTSELGIRSILFTIIAQKTNFQSITKELSITINSISAEIRTVSGVAQIEAEIGNNVVLQVILNDTIFGDDIADAIVTYNWAYGQGELEDPDDDGIYEVILENVREGVHTITIRASAGDNYDFESYTITLVVTTPTVSPGPDLSWLVYVLIGAMIGLVVLFTLYQTHFKYPPMVRKIRNLKKKVRKAKRTKPILVNKRDQIINNELQNQRKSIEYEPIQAIETDKIEKIPIKEEGGE